MPKKYFIAWKSHMKLLKGHELFHCFEKRYENTVKLRKYFIAWKKRQENIITPWNYFICSWSVMKRQEDI